MTLKWNLLVLIPGLLAFLAGCSYDDPARPSYPLRSVGASNPSRPAVGGLTVPEKGWSLSPNLLVNGSFRSGLEGWLINSGNCFSLDSSGVGPALKLENPDTCSRFYPIAANAYRVPPGFYTLRGEIRTRDIRSADSNSVYGVRINLVNAGATDILKGTKDWTPVELRDAVVPAGKTGEFRLEVYNKPSGTAWFRNLWLRREIPPPLQTFLLYPNYRGLFLDDAPRIARLWMTVNPPSRTLLSQFKVEVMAVDANGKVVADREYSRLQRADFEAALDFSRLPAGRYKVLGVLRTSTGKQTIFSQSAYAVVVPPDGPRRRKAWVDSRNFIHFGNGPARFVLGIYETSGYSNDPSAYRQELANMAQAPLDLVINYFITRAPFSAVDAYTRAMIPYGMYFLPTVNNFYRCDPGYPDTQPCADRGSDSLIACYAAGLRDNERVAGYYVQDEPPTASQPETLHQYELIKRNDPSGVTLAVLNIPGAFARWRDAADVIGTDPYPLYHSPSDNLAQVADWTRQAVRAVRGARPVWTVIQFFKATEAAGWPTRQQLHDMSWMAIVEGATGLFYWSHGARALAWVRDPLQRRALYSELIDVTRGIKGLEPVLLSGDDPVLASNSAAGTIFTKEKRLGNTRYIISYNHSGLPVLATLKLRLPANGVLVYGENRSLALEKHTTFRDAFRSYQAHIYVIR